MMDFVVTVSLCTSETKVIDNCTYINYGIVVDNDVNWKLRIEHNVNLHKISVLHIDDKNQQHSMTILDAATKKVKLDTIWITKANMILILKEYDTTLGRLFNTRPATLEIIIPVNDLQENNRGVIENDDLIENNIIQEVGNLRESNCTYEDINNEIDQPNNETSSHTTSGAKLNNITFSMCQLLYLLLTT